MPATIITTETFDPNTPDERIAQEIKLRLKAGAIRSWVDENGPKITLKTEWNILGDQ
jgi:hypothetical protein